MQRFYKKPTAAEIASDKKKDAKNTKRLSVSSASINKKVYKAFNAA